MELALFKLFVTVLSFFRATSPVYSKPKFTTISGGFTGVSQVLPVGEIRQALKDLGITQLKVRKPSPVWLSMKSGPNFPLATVGMGVDLVA